MLEMLRRIVNNDFLLMHAAAIIAGFGDFIESSLLTQSAQEIYRFTVSRQDWEKYLSKFPGHKSGKYKIVDNLPFSVVVSSSLGGGYPELYTAPNVTIDEIRKVVELALTHFAAKGIGTRNLWEIKDLEEKILVMTLSSIEIFLRKKVSSISFEMQPKRDDLFLAPLGGVFYRREHQSEPVLVEVSDIAARGQALCVIEFNKCFNLIHADQTMRILAILAEDGKEVEDSQPLFRVQILDEEEYWGVAF